MFGNLPKRRTELKVKGDRRPAKAKRFKTNTMTEEEKAAAEAAQKAEQEAASAAAIAAVAEKDEYIAKLEEERDNYKNVALKRLGKLPGDAELLDADEKTGLTVEEQVKKTLLEREITKAQAEKDAEARRLAQENAELKLALKNRPGGSIGSDSGSTSEVKDNVFSAAQIEVLKAKAKQLNADPEAFIQKAKENLAKRS